MCWRETVHTKKPARGSPAPRDGARAAGGLAGGGGGGGVDARAARARAPPTHSSSARCVCACSFHSRDPCHAIASACGRARPRRFLFFYWPLSPALPLSRAQGSSWRIAPPSSVGGRALARWRGCGGAREPGRTRGRHAHSPFSAAAWRDKPPLRGAACAVSRAVLTCAESNFFLRPYPSPPRARRNG
jgi:hypothetical protein